MTLCDKCELTIHVSSEDMEWLRQREISPSAIIHSFKKWVEQEEAEGLEKQPIEATLEDVRVRNRMNKEELRCKN